VWPDATRPGAHSREQTWFLGQHLVPTYDVNHEHVLSADTIAVDETWW
jgi:hypothetical protein